MFQYKNETEAGRTKSIAFTANSTCSMILYSAKDAESGCAHPAFLGIRDTAADTGNSVARSPLTTDRWLTLICVVRAPDNFHPAVSVDWPIININGTELTPAEERYAMRVGMCMINVAQETLAILRKCIGLPSPRSSQRMVHLSQHCPVPWLENALYQQQHCLPKHLRRHRCRCQKPSSTECQRSGPQRESPCSSVNLIEKAWWSLCFLQALEPTRPDRFCKDC